MKKLSSLFPNPNESLYANGAAHEIYTQTNGGSRMCGMIKPTHYIVVRAPYAQNLMLGYKTFEYRTNPAPFANKRIAVAVAKNKISDSEIENESVFWELDESEKAALKKLCARTGGGGIIIGEITTGEISECTTPGMEGVGVPVISAKLWPESEWIRSPGGLGCRKMPDHQ